ncbi:hypothetical protein LTR91_022062 [Friedmanniomyces endolithicus]|uniref:Uncharacterized protein n=1 Tax=Friedmanniomyces endolithicus TaxID=329885 RepID=A0AAN6JZK8_9PEZI|nr:hypothetical protein LTS09_007828 [Friedmanniomyces endolithicus]KAK0352897.1 hypothetical protein LTR94_018976 [Friedmanniomyces endolithicus]KAK0774389.1 hypothetical protein LTR59_014910 [Friedmanniomyces endolithicus]KAK0792851.1 hypothetical protein LTR38_009712 [Friedmanniomyces endolithicus]KAK0794529.1 hypothetical protein LTR75_010837 [Friedmanniomyces endolithicus]
MSPPSFFRLPACIRCIVYDALAEAEEDVHYNRTIASSTPGHGISTAASKQQATIFRLNIMLVNKQFRREYCAELFRVWNAEVILHDTILSPNGFLQDTFQERSVLANAKSWKLGGHVGEFPGPEPQYSVYIDLHHCRDDGYLPTWHHLTEDLKLWFGVSNAYYVRVVERVEAAIRIAACEGENGLTYEGASKVIDAFHLNDPADDEVGENGDGLLDERDEDEVAWSPDETGRGSGNW